jgi:hypothetical protein
MKKIVFAATAALFALSTSAMAQTPAPSATAPKAAAPAASAPVAKAPAAPTAAATTAAAKKAKVAGAAKVRTEASLKCSADATAQNIHGKPRTAFMKKCKATAAAAAKKN